MFHLSSYILYILVAAGCATTQTSGTSSSYTEDLSVHRPVFEEPKPQSGTAEESIKKDNVEPKFTVNESLHAVLDSIDSFNVARKYVEGFTIQIYSGQKKEDALSTKKSIDQALPELKAEMTYVQPTFRIKAGKYYTQLDAQKDYVSVKRFFPNAILVPEKFSVK